MQAEKDGLPDLGISSLFFKGNLRNQEWSHVLDASFVRRLEERFVLLWNKRFDVPSNLQGLYRCEFQGTELSWNVAMKLMKAIRGFKTAVPA